MLEILLLSNEWLDVNVINYDTILDDLRKIHGFYLRFCYSEITRQHTGGELPLPRFRPVSKI